MLMDYWKHAQLHRYLSSSTPTLYCGTNSRGNGSVHRGSSWQLSQNARSPVRRGVFAGGWLADLRAREDAYGPADLRSLQPASTNGSTNSGLGDGTHTSERRDGYQLIRRGSPCCCKLLAYNAADGTLDDRLERLLDRAYRNPCGVEVQN